MVIGKNKYDNNDEYSDGIGGDDDDDDKDDLDDDVDDLYVCDKYKWAL